MSTPEQPASEVPATGQREALATVRAVWGQGAPEAKAALREQPPRWPELCAALDVLAGAVPDTVQAPDVAALLRRLDEIEDEIERYDWSAAGTLAPQATIRVREVRALLGTEATKDDR